MPIDHSPVAARSSAIPASLHRRAIHMLLALTMLGAMLDGHAASDADDIEKDKSWREAEVQLPNAPEAGNLLRFYVSATTTLSFAIDAKSLTVGDDGVVRYTLVTTSQSGARNLSHEGIRCQTMEKKLYALGRADGTWSRARKDEWEPISNHIANRQHAALAADYFCQNGGVSGSARSIVDRIRSERPLTTER